MQVFRSVMLACPLFGCLFMATLSQAAVTQDRVLGHETVEDEYGVIAPWYKGQNGQFDNRVRIAAETIKRYPWVTKEKAIAVSPEFVFNTRWHIAEDGSITIPKMDDWTNGDIAQNAARVVNALVEYYQYSGDPAAIALVTVVADTILRSCLSGESNSWPLFPISVPVKGKPYGKCDQHGWMQLDIAAELGVALLRAYQMTGNKRWLDAVTHWGELLADRRNRKPGAEPWPRYANAEDVFHWSADDDDTKKHWNTARSGNKLGGSITYVLSLYDELIRLGQKGANNSFEAARDAGTAYLRDELLPQWSANATWGYNYWDWEAPVQLQTTTDWAMRYLMAHKDVFPNWQNDVRNILSLFLNHTSANPESRSETYSGAWAFPESLSCCGSSLAWGPMELALDFAQYGVEAGSEWGRELARRMAIFSTYDALETGVVRDGIDGSDRVAGNWFKSTHPSALFWVLKTMGWLPEILGANRENHIMRSSGVVNAVTYRKGRVTYSTFDAPKGTREVLRLSFSPTRVTACGEELRKGSSYTNEALQGGDSIVTVFHAGCNVVVIEGRDPQSEKPASGKKSYSFSGNQVRLLGAVGPDGGQADVYLDGEKQLAGIDFWNPSKLSGQVLYYRNGLSNGRHDLRLEPRAKQNPLSTGDKLILEWLQSSTATGDSGVGVGGGPTGIQRFIFGYTDRQEYIDDRGQAWRPGTEFITRTGHFTDTVAKSWWTIKQAVFITRTPDDVLYQYGAHWPEITINVTVGPGTYYARLKLAETQYASSNQRLMSIFINGKKVAEGVDVFAAAGGSNTALDLVFEGVEPENGVIEVRLQGEMVAGRQSEAMLQALEVGPAGSQ